MQGGRELMVKRLQRSSQVSFPLIDSDLAYWYIIWKVNTTNRALIFKNTFCILCLWGWGFHVKSVFFFKTRLVVNCCLMSWGSFKFAYLRTRLMEKWVKVLYSESERVLTQTHCLRDLGFEWVSNTAINIGFVILPLDIGPKLAMGKWSGLPGRSRSKENFVCCLVIVARFIALGRAYRLGGGRDFEVIIRGGSKLQRDGTILFGKLTPQDTM